MRAPFVLDEEAQEIGEDVARNHEYEIIGEKCHNFLRNGHSAISCAAAYAVCRR
jgi:hypothetical protein